MVWNIEEGARLSGPQIGRAERKRTELFHRMRSFMQSYEFLISPVSQVPPFDVKQRYVEIDGERWRYIDWMKSCYYVTVAVCPPPRYPAASRLKGCPWELRWSADTGTISASCNWPTRSKRPRATASAVHRWRGDPARRPAIVVAFSVFAQVLLPILVVVASGYLLQRRLELDLHSVNRLSLYLLSPALIFSSLAQSRIEVTETLRIGAFADDVRDLDRHHNVARSPPPAAGHHRQGRLDALRDVHERG